MTNEQDEDLYTKVLLACAWMLDDSNRCEFRSVKKAPREEILERIYFEMTDYNEQASWFEKVVVEVIVMSFAGPWEPKLIERHKPLLKKLLEHNNRPVDALEQLATCPQVTSALKTFEIEVR
jgi:hypothetical protein